MGDHRVTLKNRHAYRTNTNKVKTIRTPGGRYVAQLMKKNRKGSVCGDCKVVLPGIKHMDSVGFKNAESMKRKLPVLTVDLYAETVLDSVLSVLSLLRNRSVSRRSWLPRRSKHFLKFIL